MHGGTRKGVEIDRHAAALREDPLFLDRCQVDTPTDIVVLVWEQVLSRRSEIDLVVDFGAGDARFARFGTFGRYLGYEVDAARCASMTRASEVQIVEQCAFSHHRRDADVCIGNPPYVRNQDLPSGWREMAANEVRSRTGVTLSGLANAWQYFLMLGLWSVKDGGLVAQIIPYEWVSRPAAAPIRAYLDSHGWAVDVYRLPEDVFVGVTTAASITVIDKQGPPGWRFHELDASGRVESLRFATGGTANAIPYTSVRDGDRPRAKRGLSPGTQQVLTLNEGERAHAGLHVRRDVVRCVTSLRSVPAGVSTLTSAAFDKHLADAGAKCWLIRTDRDPSPRLQAYLNDVDPELYQTATCLSRESWWRFPMPAQAPAVLVAQAFKTESPKAVLNQVGAHAVGGVAGIYNIDEAAAVRFIDELASLGLRRRLVPYAKQMRKLEINQINSLLTARLRDDRVG
jgi:hypothetical protein